MRIFARQKLTWQCRLIALCRGCAHPAGSTVAFVAYGVDYWLTGGLGIAQTPHGPQHPRAPGPLSARALAVRSSGVIVHLQSGTLRRSWPQTGGFRSGL
jgi:hypothetical protein